MNATLGKVCYLHDITSVFFIKTLHATFKTFYLRQSEDVKMPTAGYINNLQNCNKIVVFLVECFKKLAKARLSEDYTNNSTAEMAIIYIICVKSPKKYVCKIPQITCCHERICTNCCLIGEPQRHKCTLNCYKKWIQNKLQKIFEQSIPYQ